MNAMTNTLLWERDGRDWPNRHASRFIRAAGIAWHVQEFGHGPVLLLLHGTGASTHSWRDLAPMLAERFHVIALDLPGHGFTQSPPREFLSLYGMGVAINTLLRQLVTAPTVVVGHSAGAAIAVKMCVEGHIAPRLVIGLNAALMPLRGVAGHVFSPLAKLLARVPLLPQLLARRAFDRAAIETMIADTGSVLDRSGVDLYWRLAQSPGHVAAAFGMMAEWDLPELQRDLRRFKTPLVLLVGSKDRTVPPSDAEQLRGIVSGVRVVPMSALGHLAHEETPLLVAELICAEARRAGVLKDRA
jgi:magnesium chelatase accessory protein